MATRSNVGSGHLDDAYDTLVEWEMNVGGTDVGDQIADCWGLMDTSAGVVFNGWSGTYSITITRDPDIPTAWDGTFASDTGVVVLEDASGIVLQDVSNVLIYRIIVTVANTTANRVGIDFAPTVGIDSVTIDSCLILMSDAMAGSANAGIQVGNMGITNAHIINTVIIINKTSGSGTIRGIEIRSNSLQTVECNVINCSVHGVALSGNALQLVGAGTISGVIRNNAFTSNSAAAISDGITGTDSTTRDNNWTDDTTYQTDDDAGATDRQFVPADAWTDPDNIFSHDLSLTATSALKDASAVTPIAYDIIGTPRPQGAGTDIGAFETVVATGGPRNRFRLPCRRPQGLLGRPC